MTQTLDKNTPSLKALFLAARPKTLTAAFVPVLVGTSLAAAEGASINWLLPLSALLSALSIQIGTNLINDALDFKKGADTEERIGPARITQQGILTPAQVLGAGYAFFVLSVLLALPLVVAGGFPLLITILLSIICGYLYTGGPYPLAYVGLGDLFVILFFGFVATGATFYVQTGVLAPKALLAGLQLGMLATVMIAINNLRDRFSDAKANKNTLAVRFGVSFARLEIALMALGPFALSFYWTTLGDRYAAMAPWISFPLAWSLVRFIRRTPPGPIYNKFLGVGALLQLMFGILLSLGLLYPILTNSN